MENEFDLSETPLVGDGNRSGSGNQCSQGVDNSSMQANCGEHSLANSNQGDNVETISFTSTENADVSNNSRVKSVVWDHFKKAIIKQEKKAICNYCDKKLEGDSKNGTKHLHEHFKRCPRRKVRDIRQHVLVKKQSKVDGKVLLSNYHFDEDVSRNELSRMIILHEYPLSMVEHHGFRKYSTSLQPLFKVPSRNTIKNEILKIHEYEKEKTLHLLEKNEGRIAITTDMWMSSNQKKGFMAITTHFIDNHWNMQSRIMRFIYVPCPHTSDILSKVLFECMLDWNLDSKLSTITVDNCTTNDAIIIHLLDMLPSSSLLLNGKLLHMRCCAHILNLIVQDGLSIISAAIERVRDSVAFWTASPKRLQKFEEAARHLNISSTKKLFLDCKTRWNSTYLMLSVALVYKEAFMRLQFRDELFKCCPTGKDWEVAEEVCSKLQVFHIVTEKFSGTKYPTSNIFFPEICQIKISLFSWQSSASPIIKSMTTNMLEKFDKYWATVHGIMSVAAVLDPRYKLKLLQYFFPQLYGSDSETQIKNVRGLCYKLLEEYQSRAPLKRSRHEMSSFETSSFDVANIEMSGIMSGFDSFVNEADDMTMKSELDHYLEEKVVPRSVDFDILVWWKTNGFKYPTLQKIARDILAIPISTVASESAFSTGGRWVSPHRSRLHPKTLEALVCAQNWLWSNIRETGTAEIDAYCQTVEYDCDDDERSAMTN